MLIHRCFGTDLQLAFVIRSSGVSLQDKVSPGMINQLFKKVPHACFGEISGHLPHQGPHSGVLKWEK